jgi:hypothetical protein
MMATHYKGERIEELLEDISIWKEVLDQNREAGNILPLTNKKVAHAYATLAWRKAQLTSLQENQNG